MSDSVVVHVGGTPETKRTYTQNKRDAQKKKRPSTGDLVCMKEDIKKDS